MLARCDPRDATMKSESLKITARGEREIVMTRSFHAPRQMVFDAFTRPELLKQWLLGPDGWSMPVCEIDLKVGSRYRFVWRHDKDGKQMGIGGVYREVAPPARIVATEKFDEAWYPGEALVTTEWVEQAGTTEVIQTVLYQSREAREAAMKSGMEKGVARSYERLEDLLAR